jgi:hypothetical protein
MSRGSYRGGSTPTGWNANRYVSPRLTGRTRKGKALIKDLTTRTAQNRVEQESQDAKARKRHGLAGPKTPAVTKATATSVGKSGVPNELRKKLKAAGRQAFSVTVVRRRITKPARS